MEGWKHFAERVEQFLGSLAGLLDHPAEPKLRQAGGLSQKPTLSALGLALERSDDWRFFELPAIALVPRPASILPEFALAGGVVEVLVDILPGGRNLSNREGVLAEAFQRLAEHLHVRDFTRHQELKSFFCASIVAVIDESLVDDLGPRFRGDVAPEIDIQFAGDFQVVSCPWVALTVEQPHAASTGDRGERIGRSQLGII